MHFMKLEDVCDDKTQLRGENAAEVRFYSCCQHLDDQCHLATCCDFCRTWHLNRPAILSCHFMKSFGGWNTRFCKSDL